jgi:hypothetical protein
VRGVCRPQAFDIPHPAIGILLFCRRGFFSPCDTPRISPSRRGPRGGFSGTNGLVSAPFFFLPFGARPAALKSRHASSQRGGGGRQGET